MRCNTNQDCNKLILSLLFDSPKSRPDRDDAGRRFQVDWDHFVKTTVQEGVAGTIFHRLRKHGLHGLLPPRTFDTLSEEYYRNLRRNLSIIGELRGILTLIKESGIPCIVLKGIALAEQVYPSIAIRGMSDVDILVKRNDIAALDCILSSRGYACIDSSPPAAVHNPPGYLASLEYRKQDDSTLNLHVHWHIVNSSVPAAMFAERIDMERIWDKAIPVKVSDADVYVLSPEHLIIYLCEHALRVGHSFDRLMLVCDILYALDAFKERIDWDFLIEESRRFNLDRFVFFALLIVGRYSDMNIPAGFLDRLKPSRLTLGERLFLALQTNNRRLRGSSYFLYLAMNKTISDKILFLFRTAFPPRQIFLQRLRMQNDGSAGLHYLSRLREILSHIFSLFPLENKVLKKS